MLFFQTKKNNNICAFAFLNPNQYDNQKFWHILKSKDLSESILNQVSQLDSIEVYITPRIDDETLLVLTPECVNHIFSLIHLDLEPILKNCSLNDFSDNKNDKNYKIKNTKSTLQNIIGFHDLTKQEPNTVLKDTIISLILTFSTLIIYATFPIIALSIALSVCAYILYFMQEESSYHLNRIL